MTMKKIVLTGGPGGGKTTALELFKRELKNGVSIVPEAATILFENGYKRSQDPQKLKSTQMAIYFLQKSLETIFATNPDTSVLLCDRGSLDGLAYWPEDEESFFQSIHSNMEKELERYDAVIFFESGACSGSDVKSNNLVRNETTTEAKSLDHKLKEIWSKHPNFHFIGSHESFISKVIAGLETLKNQIAERD